MGSSRAESPRASWSTRVDSLGDASPRCWLPPGRRYGERYQNGDEYITAECPLTFFPAGKKTTRASFSPYLPHLAITQSKRIFPLHIFKVKIFSHPTYQIQQHSDSSFLPRFHSTLVKTTENTRPQPVKPNLHITRKMRFNQIILTAITIGLDMVPLVKAGLACQFLSLPVSPLLPTFGPEKSQHILRSFSYPFSFWVVVQYSHEKY